MQISITNYINKQRC